MNQGLEVACCEPLELWSAAEIGLLMLRWHVRCHFIDSYLVFKEDGDV